MPAQDPRAVHVYNQFGVRVRDGHREMLRQHLQSRNIGCEVYYPVPLHLQQAFRHLGYRSGALPVTERAAAEILHLPVYPELAVDEQHRVVHAIESFYATGAARRAA